MCVKSHGYRLKKQNHNGLPPARERGYWGPQGPRLDPLYVYIQNVAIPPLKDISTGIRGNFLIITGI